MCGPTHRYKYPKPPHWEHLVVFQDLPLLISYPLEFSLTAPIGFFAAVTSLVSVAAFEISFHTKKAKMKSSVLKGGATSLYADMQTLQNFHVSFYPAQAGTAHILWPSVSMLQTCRALCLTDTGMAESVVSSDIPMASLLNEDRIHYILYGSCCASLSLGRGTTIAVMAQGHLWLMFCHILERNGSV